MLSVKVCCVANKIAVVSWECRSFDTCSWRTALSAGVGSPVCKWLHKQTDAEGDASYHSDHLSCWSLPLLNVNPLSSNHPSSPSVFHFPPDLVSHAVHSCPLLEPSSMLRIFHLIAVDACWALHWLLRLDSFVVVVLFVCSAMPSAACGLHNNETANCTHSRANYTAKTYSSCYKNYIKNTASKLIGWCFRTHALLKLRYCSCSCMWLRVMLLL